MKPAVDQSIAREMSMMPNQGEFGFVTPVPVSGTLIGLFGAVLVNTSESESFATVVGANCTVTEQDCCGAIVLPQLLSEIEKYCPVVMTVLEIV